MDANIVHIGIHAENMKNNMDEEIFELAKENDLSFDEAEKLQEVMDETGLDAEEALEIFEEL